MTHPLLDTLKTELKNAIRQHFAMLQENSPGECFYGYSLYTSNEVSSIGPVANKLSEVKVDKSDPMYNYYKHSPDEWSDWDDFGLFESVNHIISEYRREMGQNFEEFTTSALEHSLGALRDLDCEGIFGEKNDERFLVVWVSDSSHEIIGISAEALNTPNVYEAFASEFIQENGPN